MLHSGIDLHKRTVVISTVDPSRQAVRDAELPTSGARIQSYFASLAGPHRAVVESTSNWYWLSGLLLSSGVDLRLAHSKYIKAISYAKVKIDAVDAATSAQLLRSDLIPEAHMVSPEWREARDLLRARLQIVPAPIRPRSGAGSPGARGAHAMSISARPVRRNMGDRKVAPESRRPGKR